ncbi:MAG: hypothetical protein RL291_2097 [Pseudomonadota bacterium]|jgi:uncharacterized protein (DUF2147 family)
MKFLGKITGAAVVAAALTVAAHAQSPVGSWTRPSTGTVIQFYDCSGKLCARITGVKDQSKKDTVGKVIMSGAEKSGDNQWKGSLLNTDDGQTYSGVVTLEGPNALNLKGCVLGGIICKGETWSRNR